MAEWFDRKCESGRQPTLEEKAALFRDLPVRFPDRAKEKIISYLQDALFELKRQYTPSSHVIAHNLLFCIAPMMGMDEAEYPKLLRAYNEALEKHRDKVSLALNFRQAETR